MQHSNHKSNAPVKAGDTVVVYGGFSDQERVLVRYTDAKSLVEFFRQRDDTFNLLLSNEEYMRRVGANIERISDMAIPCHSEDAFVNALFRLGLCGTATLN